MQGYVSVLCSSVAWVSYAILVMGTVEMCDRKGTSLDAKAPVAADG